MSDSLRPRELQHARLPYPSLSPGICSNSVSIELVMPPNHLILCRPPSPPAFNLSQEEKGTTEENQPDIWLMNCYWIANIFYQDEILVDEVHIIMDFML